MNQAEYLRERSRKRKQAGLCQKCGVPAKGRLTCANCRKKDVERHEDTIRQRDKDGLCRKCGVARQEEGKKHCAACLVKVNAYTRKHAKKRAGQGRCLACGVTCESGRCEKCRVKLNAYQKKQRKARVDNGLCRDCGAKSQLSARSKRGYSNYCQSCYLKMTARSTLGSANFWQVLLDKLYRYDWRCYYTGVKLFFGENLSFDHLNPVLRFPEQKHDPNNIVPATLEVNLMKRDLTKDEFLFLTKQVAEHSNREESAC